MTNAASAPAKIPAENPATPPVKMVTRIGKTDPKTNVKAPDEQVVACPHGNDPMLCNDGACKFRRVALPRTKAALDSIRLIGNVSGKGYTYTDEQADAIVSALRKRVDALADELHHVSNAEDEFTI